MGSKMMLPALRSQMNCSAAMPAVRKDRVEPRVNARQRDDRQFVGEIRRMQAGAGVAGNRPVVRVNNGFKQAHHKSKFEFLGDDGQKLAFLVGQIVVAGQRILQRVINLTAHGRVGKQLAISET